MTKVPPAKVPNWWWSTPHARDQGEDGSADR